MTLSKHTLLMFFAVLALTNSFGQRKQDKSFVISQARQVFRQVNAFKNYKIVTIDDSEVFLGHGTDNGGSLKGYYKGDSLKKIVEWVGLSNRFVQHEYYFDKGTLVFVYSAESRYKFNESKGEFDYSKFDKVFKGRYYFSNDILIHTVLSDNEHEKTKQEDAAALLSSAKDFIKLLNARRK